MAYTTENNYDGNGTTRLFSFTFPYLEDTDIKVSLNQVATTNFELANATQINFTADASGETSTQAASGAPKNAVKIKVYRDTNIDNLQSEFFSGSAVRAQDLNNDFNQTLYVSQETEKAVEGKWNNSTQTIDSTEAFVDSNDYIMTAAAIDDRIIAKQAARALADGKIIVGNGSGVGAQVTPSGDVTMANTGAFTIANLAVENGMIANDAINGNKIADNAVDSEHYADDSIDTAHYAPGSVDSTAIADGTIVNTDISGSAAIAHSKLASLTDGRILVGNGSNVPVGVAVSGDVTMANTGAVTIANDAVEQAMIADDAVGADQLAANAVVNASVAAGAAITLAKLEPLDNTKIIVGNGSNVATEVTMSGDVTIANTGAVTIASGAVETGMIADDAVDADKLAANAVVNASVASGAAIDHAKLAAVSSGNVLVGNGSNQAASVAMSGDVAIAAGGATTIQANAVEIGMIGCEQTTISDSDSHIPTSGAVVDYVAAQIAPIGGLEVIADDESFPNTIPAAGVVISITDAAGLSVNSSGVSTNGDALDNSTITINNFPTELRGGATVGGVTNADPYVFGSGAGLMVQSTGSSHTYNYHQALIREADFVRLSGDIDDFNQRYRVAAGASGVRTGVCGADGTGSGSYPCDGDMAWFTGSNKMYVFDAPAASTSNSDLDAAWSEVSSVGDYKILGIKTNGQAHNGSLTFDGNATQFDLFDGTSDASITSAQQLIVVLNGVIQKPNSGSYDGNEEGFYLDGSDGIQFCDGPPNNSVCFVTQIGAATTVNVPATNSITNVMIQDGAIDNAAIAANAAIAPSKIDATSFTGIGSTGHIEFKNETSARFFEASGNGTNKVSLKAPAALGADYTITLPPDDGDNLQFLQTNGSGVTDWATVSTSDGTKMPLAGGTFTGDVIWDNATNAGNDLTWDMSDNALEFDDNVKATFGDGADIALYHNGSINKFESESHRLIISGAADQNVDIMKTQSEYMAKFIPDGAVELYYNNTKCLETKDLGVEIQKEAIIRGVEDGDARIYMYADEADDDADKWQLGAATQGHWYIQNYAGGGWENNLICRGGGSVEFYHDNSKKFETDASAMTIHGNITYEASGTDWKIQCGQGVSSNIYISAVKDENAIFIERNAGVVLSYNGVSKAYTASNGLFLVDRLVPHNDDSYNIGGGSNRWDDIYATNTTIQTSDRNAKDNITDSDLGLTFVNKLTPVSYKWKGKTRTHYGLVAQDVETVLSDIGKSTTQFAGYIKSENPKEYYTTLAETQADGGGKNVGDVKKEASTTYGLRYSEFIGPLIKAVQELSTKNDALEARIATLEAK